VPAQSPALQRASAAASYYPSGGGGGDDDDDDDYAARNAAICGPAQIASGALFAFLFGGVGYVLAGGSGARSLPWLAGLLLGAALGVHATRARPGRGRASLDDDAAELDLPGLGAAAAGALAAGLLFFWLAPPLANEHLVASTLVALGAWGAHAYGKNVAALAVKLGSGSGSVGGRAGLAAGAAAAPWLTVAAAAAERGLIVARSAAAEALRGLRTHGAGYVVTAAQSALVSLQRAAINAASAGRHPPPAQAAVDAAAHGGASGSAAAAPVDEEQGRHV
jgi:hypothetical protein